MAGIVRKAVNMFKRPIEIAKMVERRIKLWGQSAAGRGSIAMCDGACISGGCAAASGCSGCLAGNRLSRSLAVAV